MRFYRLHFRTGGGSSDGYGWFTSHAEALKAKHRTGKGADELDRCEDPEPVDIEPTKAGILAALQEYASHPDNG